MDQNIPLAVLLTLVTTVIFAAAAVIQHQAVGKQSIDDAANATMSGGVVAFDHHQQARIAQPQFQPGLRPASQFALQQAQCSAGARAGLPPQASPQLCAARA